jgi:hypothetical protein
MVQPGQLQQSGVFHGTTHYKGSNLGTNKTQNKSGNLHPLRTLLFYINEGLARLCEETHKWHGFIKF